MNIPHVLSQVIRRSPSLSQILDATVEIVARDMGTDVCSIYLLDPADHRLRLAATKGLHREALGKVTLALGEGITGIVVAEMRSIAVEDASSHPGYRYFPETGEEQFQSYLGVPMAIRNRPVGAIVIQTRDRRKFNQDEIETLNTIAAQLVGVVENARLIHAIDQPDQGKHYLKELRTWNKGLVARPKGAEGELVLKGAPASGGIALGRAVYRGVYDIGLEPPADATQDPVREKRRMGIAIEKARGDILRIQEAAEKETDEEHALIFSSHLMLLNDPTLLDRLERACDQFLPAPYAVAQVFAEIESQISRISDVYIQERVEDIRDLRNRLLAGLLERDHPAQSLANSIVVAHGLPPSLVVELKVQGALAMVTERGGTTSHGALLARAMGIPAVTGVEGLGESVRTGDEMIVDGNSGKVVVRPTARTLAGYMKRADFQTATRSRLAALRQEPARSLCGQTLPLLANVGMASEVHQAVLYGAEGIGLYRTEFPFMIREDFPTREEQVRIYERAARAFPKGPIYFRILDLGGDKYHPRVSRTDESNPVLGYRSIRLMLDNPRLLKEQVKAFLQVARGLKSGILVPMVSSMTELRKTRTLIEEAAKELGSESGGRLPAIGAMIEVPAAVEIASDLAREVDFFSIGSNDLIQFTLAADRENARVSPFGDAYHPAVLRMLRRVITAGHAAGIPVSCCGEISSTPELAVLLMAMGIDSLSLIPSSIPTVKEAIRRSDVRRLREKLDEILALSEAKEIREAIARELPAIKEPEPVE
jgi:phosphotransferase system enzyme I (PtsP)